MAVAVEITRRDLTPAELRFAVGGVKDGRAARRMLALALVLEGVDRKTAAESCGMDRQTLCDWVHRYNAEGLAGLETAAAPGASHGSRAGRRRNWRPGSRPGRIQRRTAWCAGAAPISSGGSKRSSGCAARAHRRQAPDGARLPAAFGAVAAPQGGPGGPGDVQKTSARS